MHLNPYLLLAHPVVDLLSVPVKELEVHALLVLLPAELPQLQKRHLLLRQDAQLQPNKKIGDISDSLDENFFDDE